MDTSNSQGNLMRNLMAAWNFGRSPRPPDSSSSCSQSMISCPCAAAVASSERKPQTSRRKAAEQMARRANGLDPNVDVEEDEQART